MGLNRRPQPVGITWVSLLEVPGGSGQVVVNGESGAFATLGTSSGAASVAGGVSRVEAVLVQALGPGTWRFDLQAEAGFEPGSLRALAGDVTSLAAASIVFHLKGYPGERVVFVFHVTGGRDR
jgi:hypothetical protein